MLYLMSELVQIVTWCLSLSLVACTLILFKCKPLIVFFYFEYGPKTTEEGNYPSTDFS